MSNYYIYCTNEIESTNPPNEVSELLDVIDIKEFDQEVYFNMVVIFNIKVKTTLYKDISKALSYLENIGIKVLKKNIFIKNNIKSTYNKESSCLELGFKKWTENFNSLQKILIVRMTSIL